MVAVRIEDLFVKVIFGWLILAATFTSGPGGVNVFVDANSKSPNKTSNQWWISGGTGSSNEHGFGDVNISAILNSFQMGYDKRVRPNYGGQAVTVGVTMFVLSISELSEVGMVQNTNNYQIYLKYYVEVLISQLLFHFVSSASLSLFCQTALVIIILDHMAPKREVFKIQKV